MNPQVPSSIQILFILLLVVILVTLVKVYRPAYKSYPQASKARPFLLLLLVWIIQSLLAFNGVFLKLDSIPPPFFPAVLTTLGLAVYFALFYKPFQVMQNNLAGITLVQSFRMPLELIFILLLRENLLPVQMTFEGRNPDILVGITALAVAYGIYKNKLPKGVLIAWNLAGLILLFNILIVAVLSVPTPFQVFTEAPGNTIVLYFPYQFVATFLVPLALFSHLLSLKLLLRKS